MDTDSYTNLERKTCVNTSRSPHSNGYRLLPISIYMDTHFFLVAVLTLMDTDSYSYFLIQNLKKVVVAVLTLMDTDSYP